MKIFSFESFDLWIMWERSTRKYIAWEMLLCKLKFIYGTLLLEFDGKGKWFQNRTRERDKEK